VKNEPAVNSMQIAEVQMFTTVPEPSCFAVAGVGGMLLASRRRR
jgi:PEP-CTERM motif